MVIGQGHRVKVEFVLGSFLPHRLAGGATQGRFDYIHFINFFFSDGNYYSMTMVPSQPMVPTIDVPKLIKQSSEEAGWDSPMAAGGMLTHSQASKVLCGLSQEVDRYSVYQVSYHKFPNKSAVHPDRT